MNIELAGRLHPLLVHFPIGFLVLAFLLELFSRIKKFRKVRGAVPLTVFMGMVAAIIAVISGLILSDEGGYEPDLLFRHRLFGIMTAAVAIMLWLIISYEKNLAKSRRRPVRLAVFSVLTGMLTITGNFGGTITHGRGYLSATEIVEIKSAPENLQPPVLFYQDLIKPILNKKCISCHGESKQKGKLRLDAEDFILKGGKSGSIFLSDGEQSELIHRIHLSIEDEDHMPPREKEQLSNLEVEILTDWIREAEPFQVRVSETTSSAVRRFLETVKMDEQSYWPKSSVDPVSEADLLLLNSLGIHCRPISRESNYLEVVIPSGHKPDAAFWKSYKKIIPNIYSLDLGGSEITDEDFRKFVQATGMRKLNLKQVDLSKISLKILLELKSLHYLNLVSAKLDDEKLKELSGHPALRQIFVFGNNLSKNRIAEFLSKNLSIRLDTGNNYLPIRASDTVVYRP